MNTNSKSSHQPSEIGWPSVLPLPVIADYQIQPAENMLRTNMDAGPARIRRQFSNPPTKLQVNWLMNQQQFALFQAWFHLHCASWFSIKLLTGTGLVVHKTRFSQPYHAQLSHGRLWQIQAELESYIPFLNQEAVELLSQLKISNLQKLSSLLHQLVHQTVPQLWRNT